MVHSKMSVTVPDEILKEIKEISTSRNTRLSHLVTEALLDKIRLITFKNQYPRPPRLKAKPTRLPCKTHPLAKHCERTGTSGQVAGRQKPASSI